MSTVYAWEGTKEEFVAESKNHGWKETRDSRGNFALIGPDGSYCMDIGEVENRDPNKTCDKLTMFARYGRNTGVDELADNLGAYSEHVNRFRTLVDEAED